MSQTANSLLPSYTLTYGDAPAIEKVSWLGAGDFCDCYLVNDSHVFRFAKHASATAAMQRESCLLPLLQPFITVAIPNIQVAGVQRVSGQGMMGYRFLSGETLEAELLESLPADIQAVLIAQMVAFAHHLHAIPLTQIDGCNLPLLEPLPHLTTLITRGRRAVAPLLKEGVWEYYEQLLKFYSRDPTLHTYQPALLHGDLSPNHFLADTERGRLTGVIDFGDACIGDPAWDLRYICEDYGEATFNAFVSLYAPDDALLLKQKIRIYQHLNNVGYCLSMIAAGGESEIQEAVAFLVEQINH